MRLHVLIQLGIALLCLIKALPFAGATTYYVSSSQGNDTNPGTSIAMPWRSLTNVYYRQWDLKPGDSLLLKAGDGFDGPLSIGSGGAAGFPITIDRYGSGANPIIYGDHPSAIWSAVGGHAGVYTTGELGCAGYISISKVYDISGNRYTHTNQAAMNLDVWLSTFTNSNWGLVGGTVYIRTLDDGPPPRMRLFGGTVGTSGDYHVIQNLEACNGFHGIFVAGTHDIIRSNYVHDCIQSGIFVYNSSFTEVCSNSVSTVGDTLLYSQNGGNNWFHHNTANYTGGTNGTLILGILFPNVENCGIGLQQGTNNLVEHNSFTNVWGSFVDFYYEVNSEIRYNYGYRAYMGAAPMGTGLKFHHNIFNMADRGGSGLSASHAYSSTESPAPDSGPVCLYNNVIYGYTGYGLYCTVDPNLVVKNNIFVTASDIVMQYYVAVSSDYNLFWSIGGPNRGWGYSNHAYTTLADLVAASAMEIHSIYADPQFVSTNPVTAADFRLKSSSPCINIGQDLKSAGLFPPAAEYKDYLGTAIPQGAGPDIGAYENITPLGPPSSLTVTPN